MAVALIAACNEALAEIAAGSIVALDEGSIEARECARFAPTILLEMADWTVWPNLIKRAALAQVANDRPAEWNFAYAKPADFGEPIAIREKEEAAGQLPIYSTPFTLPQQDRARIGFIVEGDLIYTNVPQATFVYSASLLDLNQMTALMRRAFVCELAYRVSAPVSKLPANERAALEQKARMAKIEAMADAENKTERRSPNYVSAAEFARMGFLE
jgi:hypothetical protein